MFFRDGGWISGQDGQKRRLFVMWNVTWNADFLLDLASFSVIIENDVFSRREVSKYEDDISAEKEAEIQSAWIP